MDLTGQYISHKIDLSKIYSRKSICLATLFGGPLVAGYLIAENYKSFNKFGLAKRTWSITIVVAIVLYFIFCSVSQSNKIPVFIIPVAFSLITAYVVQRFQGDQIESHLDAGGDAYSIWRALAISLIGLLIMLIPVFMLFSVVTTDPFSEFR